MYLLFRTLYEEETGRNRQIQCTRNLMEKDEKCVAIHEFLFVVRGILTGNPYAEVYTDAFTSFMTEQNMVS